MSDGDRTGTRHSAETGRAVMYAGPLSFGSGSQADAWTCVQNARWSPERTSLLAAGLSWTLDVEFS